MTRIRRLIPILVLATGLAATAALAGGDANIIFGQKALSEDLLDEAGVDGQAQFGVAVSLDFDWPVALAIDLLSSSDDNTESVVTSYTLEYFTDVDTMELDVGVRKFWEKDKLRPYVGGGLAYVQLDARQTVSGSLGPGADFEDTILDDDDSGVGLWLNGGLLYQVRPNFNLGFDVRYSDASSDLSPSEFPADLKFDSGGIHYGIMLGYHW